MNRDFTAYFIVVLVAVLACYIGGQCCGCAAPEVKPALYTTELANCTATSSTCAASIACENVVRAKYGRALRDASAGCK